MSISRKSGGSIIIMVASAMIVVLFGQTVIAKDGGTPASLSADSLNFDLGGRVLIASGNVRLVYEDIKILCSAMRLDLSTNELAAEGPVQFWRGDDKVESASLTYNLKRKSGSLIDASTTVTGTDIKGELMLKGSQVEVEKDIVTIRNGSLTSCDLEKSHYHIEASEIKIYLDDRVVIRNVSYWEGRFKVFYWPHLVFSLKRENQFELPKVGYGAREGWYVKTTYNYYRNEDSYGSVYLDYMERLGPASGIKHLYHIGKLGEGFLYLYLLGNRNTGHVDTSAEVSHEIPVGSDTKIKLDATYDDSLAESGELDTRMTSSLTVHQKDMKGYVDLTLDGTWIGGEYDGQSRSASIRMRRELGRTLTLSCDASYLDRNVPDKPTDRYFNYLVRTTQTLGWADLNLVVENYVKPKATGEEEEQPEEEIPWNALRRLPEISLTSKPVDIKLNQLRIPLTFSATWGKYQENAVHGGWTPGVLSASRIHLEGDLGRISRQILPGIYGSFSGGATYDLYSTQDRRLTLEAETGIEAKLSGPLSVSGAYHYRGIWGWTPFVFDKLDPEGLIAAKLQFKQPKWSVSLGTEYDLYNREMGDISGMLSIMPRDDISFDLEGELDPKEATLTKVTVRLDAHPTEDFNVRFATRYLPPTQTIDRIEGDVDVRISDEWKARLTAVYGGVAQKELKRLDVGIVKDLHCRELALLYSYDRQEIWLEYRIKAFPFEGLKFGLGDQGVLFKPPGESQ